MKRLSRREFLEKAALASGGCAVFLLLGPKGKGAAATAAVDTPPLDDYDWNAHRYAYLIDTTRCIGCGMCVKACKAENLVPDGFFRTWVERYQISEEGEAEVTYTKEPDFLFEEDISPIKVAKAFFVPKLCNHCKKPPCVQVCPVGATYRTRDGVVLVDSKHCVGCGYCIQACPYAVRFLNPATRTADKCTLCFHRLVKGKKPACVAACPVEARLFADMKNPFDPIRKRIITERVSVLQPELLTEPQAFYLALDKEVR